MENKEKHFSDRDKFLMRMFNIFIAKGRYVQEEYHDFCKFAKGKSEYMLLKELGE